jgi:large subunit ribosomal protein L34
MRRHGIEGRFATKNGRRTLMRRIKKGRWNLAHFEGEWARKLVGKKVEKRNV